MILDDNLPRHPLLEDLSDQDEKSLIEEMLQELSFLTSQRSKISSQAMTWVNTVREMPLSTFNIQRFLQDFPLTEPEGRSLMALSEAFLRIPDSYTANLLLKDKLSERKWNKKETKGSLSRWGLDFLSSLQSGTWGSLVKPLNLKIFKIFMR